MLGSLQRDILEQTLKSGVQVKDWVPSYGDAPNEVDHVTTCKTSFHMVDSVLTAYSDFRERFKLNQVGSFGLKEGYF